MHCRVFSILGPFRTHSEQMWPLPFHLPPCSAPHNYSHKYTHIHAHSTGPALRPSAGHGRCGAAVVTQGLVWAALFHPPTASDQPPSQPACAEARVGGARCPSIGTKARQGHPAATGTPAGHAPTHSSCSICLLAEINRCDRIIDTRHPLKNGLKEAN